MVKHVTIEDITVSFGTVRAGSELAWTQQFVRTDRYDIEQCGPDSRIHRFSRVTTEIPLRAIAKSCTCSRISPYTIFSSCYRDSCSSLTAKRRQKTGTTVVDEVEDLGQKTCATVYNLIRL